MTEQAAPSLVDVARAAGVSTATAGRALGGYGQVSQAARDRVLAAAARLGYRPNSLARSMITGSTHTIGVLVTDVANQFFATVLRGITDVAHPAGFEVLLVNTSGDLDAEQRALRVMSEKRVDGVIVAPAQPSKGAHLQRIVDMAIPLVLVDRQVSGVTTADTVTIDNEAASREAVQHLLDLGHKRIGVVTEFGANLDRLRPPRVRRKGLFPSGKRLLGYLQALDAAGIACDDELISPADYDRSSAYTATNRLLDLQSAPTAILCTDNVLASGAFRALQDRNLSIPDQISLVGFDDEPWTTLVRPELTVVEQPNYDLGVHAGQQLLQRLKGTAVEASPRHSRLEARLVVRGSTASPRA